jgi:hypothetical protein
MIHGEHDVTDCHLAMEMGVPLHEVRSWSAGDVAELVAYLKWRAHQDEKAQMESEVKSRG